MIPPKNGDRLGHEMGRERLQRADPRHGGLRALSYRPKISRAMSQNAKPSAVGVARLEPPLRVNRIHPRSFSRALNAAERAGWDILRSWAASEVPSGYRTGFALAPLILTVGMPQRFRRIQTLSPLNVQFCAAMKPSAFRGEAQSAAWSSRSSGVSVSVRLKSANCVAGLVDLYLLALDSAPAGSFFFAEQGECHPRDITAAVSCMLGFGGATRSVSINEAAERWSPEAAHFAFGSNSRVTPEKARRMLGWSPSRRGLIEEIENGCYRFTA